MNLDPDRTCELVVQLPNDSRIKVAQDDSLQWDVQTYFLRSIEYYMRVVAWQNTKDGQSKNPKGTPEPILSSWELPQKKVIKTEFMTNEQLGGNLMDILNAPVKPIESKKEFDDSMFDNVDEIPEELKENGI